MAGYRTGALGLAAPAQLTVLSLSVRLWQTVAGQLAAS
jgi:hypothetical protein